MDFHKFPGNISPARVRKGIDALNYIISELDTVEASLPGGPPSEANKYAAKVLLMKCYLNKAVYTNRANPPTPDRADMDRIISLADYIINNGGFALSTNYFDNFSTNNGVVGNENIFTQAPNFDGKYALSLSWQLILEYGQYPSKPSRYPCYNGFTTLSDFYNKFETTDIRKGIYYSYPSSLPNLGHHPNVGF